MKKIKVIIDVPYLSLLKEILVEKDYISILVKRNGIDYPLSVSEIKVVED